MKTLKIERYSTLGHGTRSLVTLPSGDQIHGIERNWLGNRPNISCIPEGIYALIPLLSASSGKQALYFCGGTVIPRFADQGPAGALRWGVKIHPANSPLELQGCLSVGLHADVRNGEAWVSSSRDAVQLLEDEMGPGCGIAVVRWI